MTAGGVWQYSSAGIYFESRLILFTGVALLRLLDGTNRREKIMQTLVAVYPSRTQAEDAKAKLRRPHRSLCLSARRAAAERSRTCPPRLRCLRPFCVWSRRSGRYWPAGID